MRGRAYRANRANIGVATHSRRYLWGKRAVDLIGSSSLLVVLSPVLMVVAVLVKREGGGPVLYRGVRAGRFGDPFVMLKFRTMVVDAERLGGASTSDEDVRLTKIGSWLRRWKLDELPQLLNVLKGEMSLVGPRPQVLSEVTTYTAAERGLLLLRPGITDWASIHFRSEGSLLLQFDDPDAGYEEVIRPGKSWLGLRYIEEASFATDAKILLCTVGAVLGWAPKVPEVPGDVAVIMGLEERDTSRSPAQS